VIANGDVPQPEPLVKEALSETIPPDDGRNVDPAVGGLAGEGGVRFALYQGGKRSARDPRATFEQQRAGLIDEINLIGSRGSQSKTAAEGVGEGR